VTESAHEEAIIGFQSIDSNILLSQYCVKWVTNWLDLCIYGSVVQGNLPPTDQWTQSSQLKAFLRRPLYPDQVLIDLSAEAEQDELPANKCEVS
jgi:hypothetical protein